MRSKIGLIFAAIYAIPTLFVFVNAYSCLGTSGAPGWCNESVIYIIFPLWPLYDLVHGSFTYSSSYLYQEFWLAAVIASIITILLYFIGYIISILIKKSNLSSNKQPVDK